MRRELAPYWPTLRWGILALIATNMFEKSVPWLLRLAVDALAQDQLPQVRKYALLVIVCAIGMATVRTCSRITVFNVGRNLEWELRNRLLARLHGLGARFFRRMSTGEIMSRATNDVGQVRFMAGFGVLHVVNAALAYGGAFALMWTLSPRLMLYSLAPFPVLALLARTFSRAIYHRSLRTQACLGALSEHAQESFASMRLIRSFAMESKDARSFERINQEALQANMALVMLRGLMWPALMAVGSLGTLIALWFGGRMVLSGALSVGSFVAFHAYLGQLIWPTLALGYVLSVLQRGQASYRRIGDILEQAEELPEADTHGLPMGQVRGDIQVRGLTFRYEEYPALEDVYMSIEPGTMVAVVGRTGSGKSTLAALLARLLPVPPNTVYLDGQDVTTRRVRDVRRSIGYTPQEPFLFSTSVARNIGFAIDNIHAPQEVSRIEEAVHQVALEEDIKGLPEGLATPVGERGVQLSGGQKQRIALARALLQRAPVMILDDPLSAVDALTEARILHTLKHIAATQTLVLITNRISAASSADHIYVMDAGRVVQSGHHDDLLREPGLYAELATLQRVEQDLHAL
ncbi:MAG: ABC transporter ATP-binding protein [Myxococcales bacterium]|nr:ABC transporter ATP-binding protein [Myxococcales bacterium]MCB9708556.1 ABC transporter ATP-binding protein [Myxococcales bacterium]